MRFIGFRVGGTFGKSYSRRHGDCFSSFVGGVGRVSLVMITAKLQNTWYHVIEGEIMIKEHEPEDGKCNGSSKNSTYISPY